MGFRALGFKVLNVSGLGYRVWGSGFKVYIYINNTAYCYHKLVRFFAIAYCYYDCYITLTMAMMMMMMMMMMMTLMKIPTSLRDTLAFGAKAISLYSGSENLGLL